MGDLVQCLGVAERLGVVIDQRVVRPRRPWSWLAPRGSGDPREAPGRPGGPLAAPYPALAIASGRRAVPALRALKRASPATFTVFLKDPRIGAPAADLIWVPEHDRLRGPNVLVTLTSPHRLTQAGLAAARAAPDERVAALAAPRAALLLGGSSKGHRFGPPEIARIVAIVETLIRNGYGVAATPSRRTPKTLVTALQHLAGRDAASGRLFVWDGTGHNPYLDVLALAEVVFVTADSANMLGEAAMTGAPIHVVPVGGRPGKLDRFVDGLVAAGAARRWAGRIEGFAYAPIDATPVIAGEIARRFAAFRSVSGRSATVPSLAARDVGSY